ncbi:MAG: pirin family protein [Spirochaetaceae bacterium]|jgi:redox-sensitive bicupin YhaK (pirin superfamily)|nr:pirin family protein [Spirochaetaceae bacterium]
MIRFIDHAAMGRGQHGWLDSHFHFSFADYCNPDNINFGVLRVMNDDLVQSGTGFDTHPHENMEIISYVVDGELTHQDSMGNRRALTRGQVQYMSAGTGVTHSEYNCGAGILRFFQIWLFPDKKGYPPNYGDVRFKLEDRFNRWLGLATSVENTESAAPIRVHADINAYAAIINPGGSLDFAVGAGRQAYLALIEGKAALRGVSGAGADLSMRDAAEVVGEDFAVRTAGEEPAHLLVIEMARC